MTAASDDSTALRSFPIFASLSRSSGSLPTPGSVTTRVVIRDHEIPHQPHRANRDRRVLGRRDVKRNVIDPRKRPRIATQSGRKSGLPSPLHSRPEAARDYRTRLFHLAVAKARRKLFRNRAIRSVGADQPVAAKPLTPLCARINPNPHSVSEPGSDRGPRAGSPRGVVDATPDHRACGQDGKPSCHQLAEFTPGNFRQTLARRQRRARSSRKVSNALRE